MPTPWPPFDPRPVLGTCSDEARRAAHRGDSPIAAAAVTADGEVLVVASNHQHSTGDVTAHAERALLSELAHRGTDPRGLWVVSNAEPCSMCASAMIKARVAGIVYGAPAEPSMDPWLPAADVLAAAVDPPELVGPVDADLHTRAIAQGRDVAAQVRVNPSAAAGTLGPGVSGAPAAGGAAAPRDGGQGPLTFDDAVDGARRTRELYRRLERRHYGREWDLADLFMGFQGDVGDLAQLLGAHRAVRPGPDDLDAAIAHELADCLWSLLVLADELGVDLAAAYRELCDHLTDKVSRRLVED